ncbi:hypothetical protein BV898_14158 [Hypsibius exemplaris]|uniref:UPAR/Ly6 domain-containing protein n=1 Tax=Hypsibius exemplaris TaxID=2072580 RepID=A0A1W0W8K6_HYPEX|nr:hypothetical protein BV898_14158 [Hypsibius exemplaris]
MALPEMICMTALALLCLARGLTGQVSGLGCVKCASYGNGPCGLKNSFGQNVPASVQQACPAGTTNCFTYVTAGSGVQPYIRRGCGQLSCTYLPAGSAAGDVCDDGGYVNGPATGAFNVTRLFQSGEQNHQNFAALQYCQGQLCNAGLYTDYDFNSRYFVMRENAAQTATAQAFSFLASLLLALFLL